ncbi:hypothetical protein CRG98_031217 [Punica granatum]|uniref:Uncharacterized protein n=1 Tax=Punica granatum TaxID=22663 RepID=A0A2I0IWK9_PUNGR|nr:hypothetical protein CRG98_031217 [Punica granatum]
MCSCGRARDRTLGRTAAGWPSRARNNHNRWLLDGHGALEEAAKVAAIAGVLAAGPDWLHDWVRD